MMVCGIDRIEIYFEELSVRKVLCLSVDAESEEAGDLESEKSLLEHEKKTERRLGTVETVHIPQAPRLPPPVSRSSVLCCGGLVQVSKCETWIPGDSWALLLKNATLVQSCKSC